MSPKRKQLLIIGAAILALLILAGLVFLLTMQMKRQKEALQNAQNAPEVTALETMPDKETMPEVRFGEWVKEYSGTNEKTTVSTYVFNKPSEERAEQIATSLKVNSNPSKNGNYYASYKTDNETGETSVFMYDLTTGRMLYSSTTGVPLSVQNRTAAVTFNTIYGFLQEQDMYDESITVTATYTKKSDPNVTFYELHRSWKELPILNTFGLLTIGEETRLSTLSLTSPLNTLPEDPDILNATDGRTGLMRMKDFNTITVGVMNGNVVHVESNMRFISATKNAIGVISNEEALALLKDGKYENLYTAPSGVGATDWQKVYPNNEGFGKEAVITDSVLAYMEELPVIAQEQLRPYWIFKGYSQLDSGYRVQFVASVPATKSGVQSLLNRFTVYAGEQTLAQQQQKDLETPIPEPTTKPTAIPTRKPDAEPTTKQSTTAPGKAVTTQPTSAPQSSPVVPTNGPFGGGGGQLVCKPTVDALSPKISVGGYTFGLYNWKTLSNAEWYLVPPTNIDNNNLLDFVKKILDILRAVPDVNRNMRLPERVVQEMSAYMTFGNSGMNCPTRLTGMSPTVFMYGFENTMVTLKPEYALTYQEPPLNTDKSWNVIVEKNNITINGAKRPYIYYEYEPVVFTKPAQGWVVDKKDLRKFVSYLDFRLKFTSAERIRMLYELRHAAFEINTEYLYVGFIDPLEIDEKLPLTISPQPEKVSRIHMYVGPATLADKQGLEPPFISRITRTTDMVVELGSYAATESALIQQ